VTRKCLLIALLLFPTVASAADMRFEVKSNLRVGVGKTDITPPIGTRMAGYRERTSGATGVRDPIRAGVLLFDEGAGKAALVTLDLPIMSNEAVEAIRRGVSGKTGVPAAAVMVACSHNHAGPRLVADDDYGRQTIARIAAAASAAAREMRPMTIGYGEDTITFSVNRRRPGPDGKVLFQPWPEGPVDRRARILRFDDGASLKPAAVMMHLACHPNVLRGDNLLLSADYPGEAQRFVERAYGGRTRAMFVQGAGGDIRANLPGGDEKDGFRSGDEADLQWAGMELGAAVMRASVRAVVRESLSRRTSAYPVRSASIRVGLPGKTKPVPAELHAIAVGDFLFLGVPGEPLIDYQFKLEKLIGGRARTFVVGYANGYIGYIPTETVVKQGGYEGDSSPLSADAERALLRELEKLASQVMPGK
jgi:hypothetical protein